MLGTIDTAIIFAYLILMILIGFSASRKQNSIEEFFIGNGNVGTFSIACLWLASWVGGAAIVGGASKTYDLGISGGWYIICMAIGCLLFGLFFSVRVKVWARQKNLLTYPDLIEST
ncbi:MAG: sodium:solute symporter family protein, partial [Gammaproteobacteria bacterium]|nr:sodium:solute symporter family protein [Gammaproteobacteria bacterium]